MTRKRVSSERQSASDHSSSIRAGGRSHSLQATPWSWSSQSLPATPGGMTTVLDPKGRLTTQRVYHLCFRCRRRITKGRHSWLLHPLLDWRCPIVCLHTLERIILVPSRWPDQTLGLHIYYMGCILWCVHFKTTYSLDTSFFIFALDRFQNRHIFHASYHSDNGTSMSRCSACWLAECYQNFNQHAILRHVGRQNGCRPTFRR